MNGSPVEGLGGIDGLGGAGDFAGLDGVRDLTVAEAMAAARNAYRDTTRLIRLLAVIGQPSGPAQLVDETLTVLSEVFACDVTCLAHVAGDRLVVTHSCGLPEGDPAFTDGWPIGAGAREALRSNRVVAWGTDPSAPFDRPASLDGFGIRSAVWVPLSTGRNAGELLVLYRSGEPFTRSDLPVLDSVAYRLRQAVQERERGWILERLAQSGHRLAAHLDPGPLFDEAVEQLRTLAAADHTWAATLTGDVVELRAYTGRRPAGDWPRPVAGLPGWREVALARGYRGMEPEPSDGHRDPRPVLVVPVLRDGQPVALLVATRDRPRPFTRETSEITALFANHLGAAMVNAELYRALRRSETSLRLITDSISDMISVVDADGALVYASPSHLREIGRGPEALLQRRLVDLVHPDDRERLSAALRGGAQGSQHGAKVEYRLPAGRGWVWVESALRPTAPDAGDGAVADGGATDGAPAGGGMTVVSSRVIDERKRLEDELRRRATHDPLTGLANRVLAQSRLDDALSAAGGRRVGLLFCDLDKFKEVNDRLGHEAGDDLLGQVATRLRRCVRPTDLLARFGGDEFVVVLDGVDDLADVADIGRRVLRILDKPFQLGGERVRVSASVGGVLGVPGRTTAGAMLRDADAAMYAAKAQGPGQIEVFDDAASYRSLDRLGLRSQVRTALERGQLSVAYQPIAELVSGEIVAFEALLRWTHPDRGQVPPEVFIPLAEETGAIVGFGHWILDRACRQLADWNRLLPSRPVGLSVNFSASQLGQPGVAGDVLRIVKEAGVDPAAVWLEVTERGYIPEHAVSTVGRLRSAGMHFALDDFGMSHSNLNHLSQLPVERLKIDRSFVAGLPRRDVDRGIVGAILVIAESLRLDVVAEGVETQRQRAALRDLGCTLGQGYLLSPPVSADAATALLRGRALDGS